MNFTFMQKVKIWEEPGALDRLGELMRELGYAKALLVCDPGIVSLGMADRALAAISREGLAAVLYDKVRPDPSADIIDAGAELCRVEACDCVIAVGGGSSIDVGKGVNILRSNPGHILDYATGSRAMAPSPGLVAVPTTAGTGSELSNGLIVTDPASGVKVPILAVNGMAEYAVLDATLTLGLPPAITALTGLDVFSHVCESYMSRFACELTDIVCEKAMTDVVAYLPAAVANGRDMEVRRRMLSLASIGGWMLACASAHIGHSFAHVLGAKHHLPHGLACAWSLPAVFDFLARVEPGKIRRVGEILGARFDGSEGAAAVAEKTGTAYRAFCAGLGVTPPTLAPLSEADLLATAEAIAGEPLAAICPRAADARDIHPLLARLYGL
ncbi:MAG: iron-containing alcohol dehydrogenase [Desulfovibrio sp.]|nr:iron-containing alcohol dehydrogenase [Desulfovibrio sp.]